MAISPDLSLDQFNYHLPPELIAQHPSSQRSASRLLHLDGHGAIHDRRFTDLPDLLKATDLLVFNNTKVIKARLRGHKDSGGRVEVLVERICSNANQAWAHIRASKAPKTGTRLLLAAGQLQAQVLERSHDLFKLEFSGPVLELLEQHGSTPLPPYINHAPDSTDIDRYQTIYAQHPGAVAAPTAGLHFDAAMLARLQAKGVECAFVTLHVGAGTFQPVRTNKLAEHVMHAEYFEVPAATMASVLAARARGARVVAVGTTSVRALESVPADDAQVRTYSGDTSLFITPGYQFKFVDALISNFHLPQSTLLMLVSALAGMAPIQAAYAHAVAARYRFFSYGDAMFIEAAQP